MREVERAVCNDIPIEQFRIEDVEPSDGPVISLELSIGLML
jgi:hypothetical protein